MITLNLKAETPQEKTVLKHLIPMVSDVLAEKINNGVRIQKDGKTLINKKDLSTFIQYATKQAENTLAENQRKGAQNVCIDGDIIMGWAIHYFEEDSIEGKLYNEDGSEYKAPAPVKTTAAPTTNTPPKPAPKPQLSMFDMLGSPMEETKDNEETDEPNEDIDDTDEEEQPHEKISAPIPQPQKVTPLYQKYLSVKAKYEDCIVFYKLGDFYEAFGDDARTAADMLDLTLTGKDFGLKERLPMTGVPSHAVDMYVNKLVSKNYKVVLCEPIGERTVERVIGKDDGDDRPVDLQTGEILTGQAENDEAETDEVLTVSKLIGDLPDDEESDTNDDIISEANIKAYFDTEVLADLFDVLGDKADLI